VEHFGRYRLVTPLASGGMAEVWRAEVDGPAGVRMEVALKLVRGGPSASAEFARMLVEEARLVARLHHANVVQLFELVEAGGRFGLVMELVRGRDLGRVMERCRELGVRPGLARAVQIGAEVAKALAYAHRLTVDGQPVGLVHRDVSPHNILLSYEGEVKLADFGIARATSRLDLTDPGTVKGKLAYMAPEQARGEPVDGRADVFALGVVLWELCAGRRLFSRESEAATLAAVLEPGPVGPPSAWNEAVPPALDQLILAALARDPARRTGSAETLRAALAAQWLELARDQEEQDLRGLMQRLWPDGDLPVMAAEPTTLRPTPTPPDRSGRSEDSASATLLAPAGGRRRLATGAVLVLAALVAAWGWHRLALRPVAEATAAVVAPPETSPGEPPSSGHGLWTLGGADEAAAAQGEGLVRVHVVPWAVVKVDGVAVGETPQELRLWAPRARRRRAGVGRRSGTPPALAPGAEAPVGPSPAPPSLERPTPRPTSRVPLPRLARRFACSAPPPRPVARP
jgi:serine/threonine protein kinase